MLYDNQVFLLIETYGHQWKWDDQEGLSILFKRNAEDKAEFTPWDKIAQIVPVCKTPQVSEKKEKKKKKEFGRGTNFPYICSEQKPTSSFFSVVILFGLLGMALV